MSSRKKKAFKPPSRLDEGDEGLGSGVGPPSLRKKSPLKQREASPSPNRGNNKAALEGSAPSLQTDDLSALSPMNTKMIIGPTLAATSGTEASTSKKKLPPRNESIMNKSRWQTALFVPGGEGADDEDGEFFQREGSNRHLQAERSKRLLKEQSRKEAMASANAAPSPDQMDALLKGTANMDELNKSMNLTSLNLPPPRMKVERLPSAMSKSKRKSMDKSSRRITFSDDEDESTNNDKPITKKKSGKKGIGWSKDMFVVQPDTLFPRRYTASEGDIEGAIKEDKRERRGLMSTKSIRIVDRSKRDTRWKWTRLLVSNTMQPYKKMMAEDDDNLPDSDELDAFQDEDERPEFDRVRDSMLDNNDLTEREVAAFFEGFSLFNVKVQSLKSQLESLKVITRENDERSKMMRSFRKASMLSMSSNVLRRQSEKRSKSGTREAMMRAAKSVVSASAAAPVRSYPNLGAATSASDSDLPEAIPRPSLLQKSIRAMSIKKIQTEHKGNAEVEKLLKELEEAEKKQKKLEKQLQQAGIVIAEDIPYEEAKEQMSRIAKRMGEIGSSEVTHEDKKIQASLREEYFKLEQDMEKYNAALMATDEWAEEQEEMEQRWEDGNANDNLEALKKLRRHMPVNVKSMSEAQLATDESPNGKVLPKAIAKKFKRTNVLQLLRVNPEDIVRMHPSTLENLRVTGLTLTERRAIYSHLKEIGPRWKAMSGDQMTERKWTWFKMMKQNFRENLDSYQRHVDKYGPPGDHPYASRKEPNVGCPLLGKQCPLKADKIIDYDNDYGFTDAAEYEVSNLKKADKEDPGAKAMREAAELAREKKSKERSDTLKKHYKGVLQVSLANGSCESMDETMDRLDYLQTKWIEERVTSGGEVTDDSRRKEMAAFSDALNELKLSVLQYAERSGMQLTGKKDANADQPDIRSTIELGLCEEVYEAAIDFFDGIKERIEELKSKDKRMKSTIEQLRELLDELHDRNMSTLKELGAERPEPSRKRKSREALKKEFEAKLKAEEAQAAPEEEEEYAPPPAAGGFLADIAGRGRGRGGGGRGDLMSAIAGRGRGRGRGREGESRGGLMAAIAARGRGRGRGRGGGDEGGRGGLMAAIAARGRGRGRGRGGGDEGGRGGLMAAIAARGRGRGRGGARDAGGRGDLMSAIAARGRGRGSPRDAGGGRGDLMSAIAARGRGRGRGPRDAGGGRGDLMSAIAARGSGGGGRGDGGGAKPDGGRGNFLAAIQARRVD